MARPSLFRQPDFARLWVGQTLSQIGSQIGGTAIGFLAILTLNMGAGQLGVLNGLRAIPALAFGLFAGVIVDRLRRKPLLIAADLGRAGLLALIPILALTGGLRVEHLYVITLGVTSLAVLFDVAYPAYLPALVEPGQLVEGNSKLAMSDSIAEITGPGLGGALTQALSPALAIAFDAVSFVASALSLGMIRRPEPPPAPAEARQSMLREARDGLRLAAREPILRALLGADAVQSIASGIIGTLYLLYVTETLGVPPVVNGLLIGIGGVSALIGAAVADRVTRRFGIGPTMVGARLLSPVSGLLLVFASGPLSVVVAMLALAQATDAKWAIYGVCEQSLRQAVTPNAFLGRVSATGRLLNGVLLPIGALLGGALGEWLGLRPAIGIGFLVLAASMLFVIFSPIRTLRALPVSSGDQPRG